MSDDQQRHRRARIAQAVRELGSKAVYLAMGFGDLIELHLAAVPPRDCIVMGHICDGGMLTNGSVSYRSTLNSDWTRWDDLATMAGAPIVIHQMFPEFVRQDVAWYLRALGLAVDLAYREVVHAAACDADGNCPECGIDYAECSCPGPTQDDQYEYKLSNRGLLMARRLPGPPDPECPTP